MKYTIISDSCCNLFQKDMNSDKIDFHVAPLHLVVGEEEFVDNNIDTAEFITKMKACKTHAKSACPSPNAFAELMRKGDNVIVVSISSKLSGTYASAAIAADIVRKESPNKNVFVLDTLSASAGQDTILLRLKGIIDSGKYNTFEEVTTRLIEISSKTRVRFLLQDLTNLIKNGRMGKIIGRILSTAKIKLICGDNGAGEIKKYGMTISTKKGLNTLSEFPKDNSQDDIITIAHAQNETDASFVKRLLESKFGLRNIKVLLMRGLSTLYACDKGIVIAY